MELIITTATALATMITVKALEKIGGNAGDAMWIKTNEFLTSLRKQSLNTAQEIEQADEELFDYEKALSEIVSLAEKNPELNQLINDLVKISTKKSVPGNFAENYTKANQAAHTINKTLKAFPQNLPRSGAKKFVGGEKLLNKIHEKLQQSERIAILILTGMAGIGKTELALQYALGDSDKQPKERNYKTGICWINVGEEGNVGIKILDFAEKWLEIPILKGGDLKDRIDHCWKKWGKEEEETLIIFDDVRKYEQIYDYLPPQQKRFKVIITSRKQRLSDSFNIFHLKVLEEQIALDLLISFLGETKVNNELEESKKILKELGYLPLGLELVARFLLRRPNLSINKYIQRLKDKKLTAKELEEVSQEMTAERGVKAAFEISWQQLNQEDKTVACYLSLFEVAPIYYDLIKELCPIENENDLEEILHDNLINLSLVKNLGNQIYEIHPLIRKYLRDKLEASKLATLAKKNYCQLMVNICQQVSEKPLQSEIQKLTSIIPHLIVVAKELNQWIKDDDLIWIYVGLERFYEGQGLYQEAEPWYEQCLLIVKQRLDSEHPDVARSMNDLAGLYKVKGLYDEAEQLYKKALELRKKLLGEEHPDVAQSLNDLAGLYKVKGLYDEAEQLYKKALELRKRLLGEEHPDVAQSLNNLAALYDNQGRYEKAELLYKKSINICVKILGEQHPNTKTVINNCNLMISKYKRL